MKYTCQPTENSLDELGIPKNPYFDPSHASVASFWLIPGGGILRPPPCPDAHIYIPALKGLTIETILEVFPSIHVTANSIFTAICITLDLNIYYSRPLERFLYKTHLTQH